MRFLVLLFLLLFLKNAQAQTPPAPPNIEGMGTICPGGTVVYTIPESAGASFYRWTFPAGAYLNGNPISPVDIQGIAGTMVTVTFGNAGGQLCAMAGNINGLSAPTCKLVVAQPIPPTILPPVTICYEDAPYTLPWGDAANTSGTYSTTLISWLGCDSVVKQKVTVLAPIFVNIGVKYLCAGNCVTIGGDDYCQPGQYSVVLESYRGCDSVVNFAIAMGNPNAVITPSNPVQNCITGSAVLQGSVQGGNSLNIWKNSQWQIVGNGTSYTATNPGAYHLIGTWIMGGVGCFDTATVTVAPAPVPVVSITQLPPSAPDCDNPQTILATSSSVPGSTYTWYAGPVIQPSFLQNPVVTQSGTYKVVVTTLLGCTAEASTTVVSESTYESVEAEICPGESYLGYNQPGDYYDTLSVYPCGCYQIRVLHLQETNVKKSTVTATICPGESYGAYNQSGTYQDLYPVSAGCDSLRTLVLTVADPVLLSASTQPDNGSGTGGATLSWIGGLPPYKISWSSGDTSAVVTGLHHGLYFAQITDGAGCVYGQAVKVPFQPDSIAPINPLHGGFVVFPNPARKTVYLKMEEGYQGPVYLINRLGQLKKTFQVEENNYMPVLEVPLNDLPEGLYFIVLNRPEGAGEVQKLWVKE